MNTPRKSVSVYPSLMTLPHVRQAEVVCPLCIFGIALIFWAKPSSGATVTGLAFWTVTMQALSAVFLVLAFRAAKSISDVLAERKIIQKISLPEKDLLDKAFRTGRYAPIDTRPHPEHLSDWLEHNEIILRSIIVSFEEHYIISPEIRGEVYESFHKGLSELIFSQPDGGNAFAVSKNEVKIMIDQIFPAIEYAQ